MNSPDDPSRRTTGEDDLLWLDRLVDGELDDQEERRLLARLDLVPDGWRRCALAFLEARFWQREIGAAASDWTEPTERPESAERPAPVVHRSYRELPGWQHAVTALAVAALLMLSFGLGRYIGPWGSSTTAGGPGTELVDGRPAGRGGTNDQSGRPDGGRREMLRPQLPAGPTYAQNDSGSLTVPVANLTVDAGQGQPIQVPVYDWNERIADQLMRSSDPLPANLIGRLKRHEVRRRQRFVPIQLEDGRHIVVPIEEVDIVPVGSRAY